jgi:hypothetical protein
MSVQTITLGKQRFVLLREKDYVQLKACATSVGHARQARQQRENIAEAKRRLADPNDKVVLWTKARKELGI